MNTPDIESLTDYHQTYLRAYAPDFQPIYVFSLDGNPPTRALPCNRRDFYNIGLCASGTGTFLYAGQEYPINQPSLVLCNPLSAYSCNSADSESPVTGFSCLFTADVLHGPGYSAPLHGSPLFELGANPVFTLSAGQCDSFTRIFDQMLAEVNSDYRYKYDLLRTHLQLLLHETLRLQPQLHLTAPTSANRLATQFVRLLEDQFPIHSPDQPLELTTADAFATQLGVHVNYLNRILREVTGRTTTNHLTERIAQEAKSLLRYSAWPIAVISDSLGFANATYFNHFFRRHMDTSPRDFRQHAIGELHL